MEESYEIFKKHPDGMFVWLESAKTPEAGKERLKELADDFRGEYKLFCRGTRQVVAEEISEVATA